MQHMRFGYISIVVDDVFQASNYYHNIFGAKPKDKFYNFNGTDFSQASEMLAPDKNNDIKKMYLEIPGTGISFELVKCIQHHNRNAIHLNKGFNKWGMTHICFKVKDIGVFFNFIQSIDESALINYDESYHCLKIDKFKPSKSDSLCFDSYDIFNHKDEHGLVGDIRNFYFLDRYGIKWEFEEFR